MSFSSEEESHRDPPPYVPMRSSPLPLSLSTPTRTQGTSTRNLYPSRNRIEGKYWKYIKLYRAALEGNWEEAEKFGLIDALSANLNSRQETALHVAVQAGNKAIQFVRILVEKMSFEDLERRAINTQTVLIYAAAAGNTQAASILVGKHPRLLYICDSFGFLPVHVAANSDHKDTFQYLLSETLERFGDTEDAHGVVMPFADMYGLQLVKQVIISGYYDEALELIGRFPELAKLVLPNVGSVLSAILSNMSAFRSGSHLSFWENAIYSCVPVNSDQCATGRRSDIEDPVRNFCIPVRQRLQDMLYKVLGFLVPPIKHIGEKKKKHCQAVQLVNLACQQIKTLNEYEAYESIVKGPLLSAAEFGVKEVVEQILQQFPDAILFRDREDRSVLDLAILHRQEKVFNFIYRMDLCKNLLSHHLDMEDNSILHLAGILAPQSKLKLIPGAVLQMQREMQWFQEVEKFLPPKFRVKENKDRETPAAQFTAQHEKLVREGEDWMKGVANSCTIVASLIATIAFAAAITVPGGNHGSTGLPIFSNESAFIVFAFSNALSLFTAATSLLMFLSIFTSRYGENDFLYVLPKRLIIGLVTLFLSITTMMIAFTAVLCLVAGKHKEKILIPTAVVASVPIYIFMSLQFPLLLDLIYSMYGSIFRTKK